MTGLVPHPAEVVAVRRETEDVSTLELYPRALPEPAAPGQFFMLYLPGAGEAAISSSGDPRVRGRAVVTIRAVGDLTRALVGAPVGTEVGLRGPFGAGWPMAEAREKDVLVVAGGLGIAPLRPVLYAIAAERETFGRVRLFYGARSPEHLLYTAQLDRWARRSEIEVETTVDRAGPEWPGAVGVVPALIDRAPDRLEDTLVLLCGPEVMMRFAARSLEEKGVPPERVFVSLERHMQCALGTCGRCQLGPFFVCADGPVLRLDRVARWLAIPEV